MSKPHSEHIAAFKAWALATTRPADSEWYITRAEARSLFEQYEDALQTAKMHEDECAEVERQRNRLVEQLEAAREDVLFLCSDEDDIRKGLREQLEAMREALTFLRDLHDEHDPRCASLFEPPSRSMECDCELGIIEGALRGSSPASEPKT